MSKAINKVIKNSVLFTVCVIACKAIGFFLLPIYTSYLTTEEYGIANTVIGFTSTFDILVMLALREALIRFYNTYDEERKKVFVGSVVTTVIFSGIVICSALAFSFPLWIDLVLIGVNFFPIILCGILTLLFETIYITYQSVLQSRQDGKRYSINSILYSLMQMALNILFITVFKMGAFGIVFGLMIANVIFSVYGVFSMLKKKLMVFSFDRTIMKKSLIYSLPFIPHNMSSSIANFISKLLLNNTVSYAATGLYSVSSQISTILSMVQQALNLALRPWFNEQIENGQDGRKNIKLFSSLVFSIYTFFSVVIACFSQEAIYLLTAREYHESWKIVPILIIALVIEYIYYIHILTIMYDIRASKWIALCSITGSLTNVIMATLLIPSRQSFGAAIAFLISKVVISVITVILSRRLNVVDFNLKSMILKISLAGCAIILGLLYSIIYGTEGIDITNVVIKIFVIIVTGLILFYKNRRVLLEMISMTINKRKKHDE